MFISRYLGLVNLISPYYKVFTQRPMSILYDNGTKKTEGIVEFMLARGLQTPKKPHFFLHEYKPEKRRDNDVTTDAIFDLFAVLEHLRDKMRDLYKNLI